MTCYHPQAISVMNSYSKDFLDKKGKPKKKVVFLGSVDNLMDVDVYKGKASEVKLVPCGKCIGCRIDKARDWAVRICCESSLYSNRSWFITLTYDDNHLLDPSLSKKDFQNFIKDLRNYLNYRYGSSVRYFGCGEYGDISGRKHFHIILFGLPELDFTPRSSRGGFIYYESKILNDLWSKGYVVIADLNLNTASYVARYTLKKQGLKKYDDLGIQPPFILMSTRPGIGYEFLKLKADDLIKHPYIFLDHKNYPLPKYFKRILEEEYHIPTEFFNDELIEKNYQVNLLKEIYSKNDLKHILEAEEYNLEAKQRGRKL